LKNTNTLLALCLKTPLHFSSLEKHQHNSRFVPENTNTFLITRKTPATCRFMPENTNTLLITWKHQPLLALCLKTPIHFSSLEKHQHTSRFVHENTNTLIIIKKTAATCRFVPENTNTLLITWKTRTHFSLCP
jgi:hypothetical protein